MHLSDLHFGRETPAVVDGVLHQLERQRLDAVIVSGDLTQRARSGEFSRARELLSRVAPPLLVVPGNHDLSAHRVIERFARPWKKWQAFIDPILEPELETPDFLAVGVNSARRTGLYLDWSRGRINESQVERVVRRFDDVTEDRLRMVIVHHPFWLPPGQEKRELIGNRDSAIARFSEAGVDLILSGHVHIPFMETLEGVVISHAGTATSNRLRPGHANSFNLLEGDRRHLRITTMVWRKGAFHESELRQFKRLKGNWEPDSTGT